MEAYVSERLVDFHFSFQFSAFQFLMTRLSQLQFVTRDSRNSQLLLHPSAFILLPASPSAFAQVFRRVVGVTPTVFRNLLQKVKGPPALSFHDDIEVRRLINSIVLLSLSRSPSRSEITSSK